MFTLSESDCSQPEPDRPFGGKTAQLFIVIAMQSEVVNQRPRVLHTQRLSSQLVISL